MRNQTRKRRRQKIRPPTPAKPSHISKLKTLWPIVGFFITLGSAVVMYYELTPKVIISNDAPINPHDPFSTPFEILNDGYFSLYNVWASCYFHGTEYKKLGYYPGGFTTIGNPTIKQLGNPKTRELSRKDIMSSSCWNAISTNDPRFGDELKFADISIFVDYQPLSIWPHQWRQRTEARFVTVQNSEGALRWFRQPIVH